MAVLADGWVTPLAALLPEAPVTFDGLLEDWDKWVAATEAALPRAGGVAERIPERDALLGVPGVERPTVYCAGANYVDHIAEMGVHDIGAPFHFVSPPGVLNAPGRAVERPVGVEKLDWEIELAVLIGRSARRVSAERALEYVAGYAVANDVSARDDRMRHAIFGVDWMFAKSGEGMTPIGPAIVPAAFIRDPGHLELSLTVNGETRQLSSTSKMIVGVARQIELLSGYLTLRPGDLILTGTPAGTAAAFGGAYLGDGDEMVATIDQLGSLRNTVAPAGGR